MNNIKILKKAIENDKLTIFVGAGVSMGAGLPSWGQLISLMESELRKVYLEPKDYLLIAEDYYNKFGEEKYLELIKKEIPDEVENFKENDIVHKLIFDLKPKNVITTNYDKLLEKTVEKYGLVFDVISKDEHLVNTNLYNHIIKMHGEFKTDNIVLKQSDYNKYTENFPLIENYIKSILSSNTILFLGYGYGDSTLHNIVKWLRDASDKYPPMFLTTFSEDKEKIIKLKNVGIDTIILEKSNTKYEKFDKNTNKVATLLNGLINPLEINIDTFSDKDVVDYIYSQLNPLEKLNIILPEQIQNILTNCGFKYMELSDNQKIMLINFYEQIWTDDSDENIRTLYQNFKQIVSKENDDNIMNTLIKTYNILIKANIDGICINEHCESNSITFNFRDEIHKDIKVIENQIYNFDFFESNVKDDTNILELMKKAFLYYQQSKYLEAFTITKETIIPLCLKQENYIQLFFAMFNYNRLLRVLKLRLPDDNWNEKEHESYDLEERYYQLPRKIQLILKGVKPFFTFEYLNKFAFDISVELEEKNIKAQQIRKGQMMFSMEKDITKNYSKQKALVSFILNNCLMYESTFQFNQINKNLVEISLARQIQKDKVELDKLELFSAIKYISHKDFKIIFKKYYEKDSEDKGKLLISNENLDWIVLKVLPNIIHLMVNNRGVLNQPFLDEFQNIMFLLSLVKLENQYFDEIIKSFKQVLEQSIGSTNNYELLNNFIIIHYSLYKDDMPIADMTIILNMIIEKILDNKINTYDMQELQQNGINHLFGYMDEYKQIFSDSDSVEKVLEVFKKYHIKDQVLFSKNFLLKIYTISIKDIQKFISYYINSLDFDVIKGQRRENLYGMDIDFHDNYGLVVSFKLLLIIYKIKKIDDDIYSELNEYWNQKTLFTYGDEITKQLKYLVEEFAMDELQDIFLLYQEKSDANKIDKKRPKSII